MVEGTGTTSTTPPPPPLAGEKRRRAIAAGFIGIVFLFYFCQLFHIGMDIRAALWSGPNMREDIDDAMTKSDMILTTARDVAKLDPSQMPSARQVIRGWIEFYNRMDTGSYNQDVKLDYPPMRSLILVFWERNVEEQYPGLHNFPSNPLFWYAPSVHRLQLVTKDVAQPMLEINSALEGLAALSMFLLVWLWANRGGEKGKWGDRLLLAPVVVLFGLILLRPLLDWRLAPTSVPIQGPVDPLVTSVSFWVFLIVGFLAVVGLARFLPPPYRGPACGLVAATLVWLNPPMLIDGHVWPQWDVWLPAFFLLAALLASVDWWLCAGLVLGIGCMFKGQILFAAPVLLLAPLIAGWPGRFVCILSGLAAAAGVVVSPWLLSNPSALHYAIGVMAAAVIVCATAASAPAITGMVRSFRRAHVKKVRPDSPLSSETHEASFVTGPAERLAPYILILRLAVLASAGALILWILPDVHWALRVCVLGVAAGILAAPWFIRRWYWPTYFAFAAAAGIWIAGFALNGKFAWWDVGFAYGTRRWQQMQLGALSLSNLCSLLQWRFGWRLHDPAMDWLHLDLRQTLGLIYLLAIVGCAIGAAVHVRRRDPRFLIAIVTPWVLFPTILTQMAARYTILPAVIAASLIGVSTGMSLMGLLMTLLGCIMLGNQYIKIGSYADAPVTGNITQPTFPGLAWAALLAAVVFLYCAIAPPRRDKFGESEL
jgi:hypothetical protein